MSASPSLAVRIGQLVLPNPVLSASGTFGYGLEAPDLTGASRLGAVVTKTVTLEPRAGNPPPRLHETPSGLINSIGLQNVGIERFLADKLPPLAEIGCRIVVSIGGRRSEEYGRLASILDGVPGVAALEVNISCPNVKEGGIEFCQIPEAAAEVVSRVRRASRLPVLAKLSPNVTHIGVVARACEDAGADGVTAVNTFVGLCVDPRTGRSRIAAGRGGVSGPAIRPLALAKVLEVVSAVSIPVIGSGGIASAEDALEFLVVGARAVQVGTAGFRDPAAAIGILDGIRRFLEEEGFSSVEEIIGTYKEGR